MINREFKKNWSEIIKFNSKVNIIDDIQDLEIIKRVGLSCCPSNAQQIIKENSKYVSTYKGGEGFVRDVSNFLLEYK